MQAVGSGLGWGQVLAMATGAALVMLFPAGLALWDRRTQRLRNESPPLKQKLLRPPGYSLFEKLDRLWDRMVRHVFIGVVAGMLVGLLALPAGQLLYLFLIGQISLGELVAPETRGLAISGLLLLIGCGLIVGRQATLVYRTLNECINHRLGLRGEQAVAEALHSSDVARAGYTAFHDVPGDGPWNIDHIAVGPVGVFVIETKTRSKRRSTNHLPPHEVEFDGQALQFPWGYDKDAVPQALRNTDWVRQFLNGFGPPGLVIQPVVVIPGWYVRTKGNYAVKAMNDQYLADFIRTAKPRYSAADLTPVLRRLEERCRTLEF